MLLERDTTKVVKRRRSTQKLQRSLCSRINLHTDHNAMKEDTIRL